MDIICLLVRSVEHCVNIQREKAEGVSVAFGMQKQNKDIRRKWVLMCRAKKTCFMSIKEEL